MYRLCVSGMVCNSHAVGRSEEAAGAGAGGAENAVMQGKVDKVQQPAEAAEATAARAWKY